MKNTLSDDPRWLALQARSARADGDFVYGVVTTGVYCKPSCPSRLPKPEHVQFFDNVAAAEAAGLRPCKRCKPDQLVDPQLEKIALACRLLEQEQPPSLTELAAHAGLSKDHFQRLFKRVMGLSPKAYAQAHRAERLRAELQRGASVTEAIFAAGYNANSRFYEKSDAVLGMTATRFKRGGEAATIKFAIAQASLGAVMVAATDKGICAILLDDDPDFLVRDLQDRFPRAELIGGDTEFERQVATVIGFIEQPALGLDLPLDIRGTAFQQRVWQALRAIPAGSTASYTEVAERIGSPRAVRAVAGACAANALAVVIPCHRVVRQDGDLSGYRWGVERKRELLARERQAGD